MSNPAVTFADAERATVDHLVASLPDYDVPADLTVGVDLPGGWTPSAPAHVLVALDASDETGSPIRARATIRLTVWASGTTEAKRLCGIARAVLIAHRGDERVYGALPGLGVRPATDPDTRAPIATGTVLVDLKPTVLTTV